VRRLAFCSLAALVGCAHTSQLSPVRTVAHVDLGRYVGTWYEIAAIPQRFQKGCVATRATYTMRADGDIDVVNRCREAKLDGPERVAKGRAWVTDPETNARLKVSFFWPFRGDYWVIDLDPEYRFAVVGHPDRTYGWILSREPRLPEETYQGILERLRQQGYDPTRFVRTLQPATDPSS
jgi:apolipoprotein D and lipocalin family protein